MSKCQKLGFSTNYRFSKMHCLEYCYCLITITIISILIVIFIIYHHAYCSRLNPGARGEHLAIQLSWMAP